MTSRNALGNLANRYRAVLKKCRLLNLLAMTLAAAGLLCGGYGTALAEDVALEQKNIHFRSDSNYPDGYSKDYDGSLSITITATGGVGSGKNYNDEDFSSNEGNGKYNNKEFGTAVLLWNNSRLSVANDLDITVQPADWEGGKYEAERGGIDILSGGTMTVGGNTTILVDNYRHTDEYPPSAVDEDYGMDSQKGISISGEESSLDLQGNLDITMLNGNRSMGILAEYDAALTVGGDTTITVRNAPYYTYGIGNRYSDQKYALAGWVADDAELHFKGDLDITTEGGNNSIGINLQDSSGSNSFIQVDGHLSIHASGAEKYENRGTYQEFPNAVSNYGIFLNGISNATFNSADITTIASGAGVESIGTYLYWGSMATFTGDVSYVTQADSGSTEIAALSRAGSYLDFQRGLKADADVVLNASGNASGSASTILVNSSKDPDAVVQLKGNIVAGKTSTADIWGERNGNQYDSSVDVDDTENLISANFLNADSWFTGVNEFGNKGSRIELAFADGGRWNMTGSSAVSALTLDKGIVDLTYEAPETMSMRSLPGARTLTIDTLNGSGGTFVVNTDIDGDLTDQIIIAQGTGAHGVYVTPTGSNATRESMDSFIVQQQSGDGSFSLANDGGVVDQGMYFYELAERSGDAGAQEWYLRRAGSALTPVGETEAALSGMAGHYAMWYGQLTDLRKRLGEVRYGTQTGLWVRGFADKTRLDGFAGAGFTQNLVGGSIGYDWLASAGDDAQWILGMQIRSGHADQDVTGRHGGYGDLSSVGGGLYATWVHADGWYVDAVATMDWYEHEIRTAMTDGTRVHDDRSSWGAGLSIEGGRRFDFAANDSGSWFVEPQLELSWFYVDGGNFTASNGMAVDQDNMHSLTGRAGAVLGRKFVLDGGNGTRYVQPYVKAGLVQEFLGEQKARFNGESFTSDLDGTRVYYGLGVDWQAADNMRLYLQAEREEGEHFTREYNVSAGLKFSF